MTPDVSPRSSSAHQYKGTKICCCVADIWVKIYSIYVIVTGAVGVLVGVFLCILWVYPHGVQSPGAYKEGRDYFVLILCAILFGTGLRMGLGALLLIGTIKKNTCFLRVWIVLLGVALVLVLVGAGLRATDLQTLIVGGLDAAFIGFVLYTITTRVEDIERGNRWYGPSSSGSRMSNFSSV